MKFSNFTSEKKSLFIAWASFRNASSSVNPGALYLRHPCFMLLVDSHVYNNEPALATLYVPPPFTKFSKLHSLLFTSVSSGVMNINRIAIKFCINDVSAYVGFVSENAPTQLFNIIYASRV